MTTSTAQAAAAGGPALAPAALGNAQAALYVGVAPGTLANWRARGEGPSYVRVGTRIVYRVADLDAWLASNVVKSGGA